MVLSTERVGGRTWSILASVTAVGLLLSACSSPEQPRFSGEPFSELASYAEARGAEVLLAEDCELNLTIDEFDEVALDRYASWSPSGDLPADVLQALVTWDVDWVSNTQVTYCGSLDVQQLPPLTRTSPGLPQAREICGDIYGVTLREASAQRAGQLEDAIGWSSDVDRLAQLSPRFVGLQRYHFYAYNLHDFVQGLEDFLRYGPNVSGIGVDTDVDTLRVSSVLDTLEPGTDLYESLNRAIRYLDGARVEAQRLCQEVREVADTATLDVRNDDDDSPVPESGPLSCSAGGVCSIGDTGPGGGIVFYDAGEPQEWGTYLEVAPMNWNGGSSSARDRGGWWCGKDTSRNRNKVEGLETRTEIGSGAENTAKIIQACGENNAAGRIASAQIWGLSDWFLPSRDELAQLMLLRGVIDVNFVTFENTSYYSSSTADADFPAVWAYSWDNQEVSKQLMFWDPGERARPIRAFSAQIDTVTGENAPRSE